MPLVMDGVKEARADEYHWYVARASKYGSSLAVVIPAAIARHLGLKPGDAVEVAVRRATEDAIREHGGVYGRRRTRRPKVKCPRCGGEGTLQVKHGYVYVAHGNRACYICPARAVEEKAPELKDLLKPPRGRDDGRGRGKA